MRPLQCVNQEMLKEFNHVPMVLVLLDVLLIENKTRQFKYVMKKIEDYNYILGQLDKTKILYRAKNILIEMVKKEFRNSLFNDVKLLSKLEKERLNGYYLARYRESIRKLNEEMK